MGFPTGNLVLPSSTGVIGWRLPVQAIIDVVVRLFDPLVWHDRRGI